MAKKTSKKPAARAKATPQTSLKLPLQQLATIWRSRWMKFFVIWALAYSILLSFFFRTVLRNTAYLEIFPKELLLPSAMHAFTALLITLSVFWVPWIKTYTGKLISALTLALMCIGYDGNLQLVAGTLRAFIPGVTANDPVGIVSIIYVILLFGLSVLIGRNIEKLLLRWGRVNLKDVKLGLAIFALYLLILPAFSILSKLPAMIRESNVQAQTFPKPSATPTDPEKPDIYYIVLDRYTNAETLKNQFNYDNRDFTTFLQDKNFKVNDQANSNYPYTTMSIASTMNAQYTKDLVAPFKNESTQSRTLYHNLIWQSSVAKALKQSGYQYYAIGSWYGATYKAPIADVDFRFEHQVTFFGLKKRIRGIEAVEFMQSPYYRLAQLSTAKWWPFKTIDYDPIADAKEQLNMLTDISTNQKPGGRFVFAHLLVPHDPFIFNSDGSLSTNSNVDNIGKPIKEKYTNQIDFINTQMKQLVDNIEKQSNGKAVVIFNSDEGAYPQVMNNTFLKDSSSAADPESGSSSQEDMTKWSDDWLHMKFGILQAAHIPRATKEDLAHLSSVNVFRIVLNRYAGHNLGYLPECHFGLVNGNKNEYLYADITQRFTDSPDDSCKNLESIKDK